MAFAKLVYDPWKSISPEEILNSDPIWDNVIWWRQLTNHYEILKFNAWYSVVMYVGKSVFLVLTNRIFFCFPSRSDITCKYNTSVDNTTLYLYTKVIYFVRVACFDNSWICLLGGPGDDLIRSKHVAQTKYTIFVYK